MARRIFFSFLFCLLCFPLFAETIELKNGKVFQGRIVIQDQNSIYLETAQGTTNIKESDIRSIDGKIYELPGAIERPQESEISQKPGISSAIPHENEAVPNEAQSGAGENQQDLATQTVKQDSNLTLSQAMKAVPFIKVEMTIGESIGSGAIINPNGTILTNAHVVEGTKGETIKSITVTLYQDKDIGQRSKREYEARVIKIDPVYDLAIIDIHAETPDYFRYADENELKVGDEVRACGNPNGLDVSFSKGIISAIRTNKERFTSNGELNEPIKEFLRQRSMSEREFNTITWIQTDAAINPGNSGGPLLNADNQIIGINSRKAMLPDGQLAEGLGFALHVKHLKKFAAGYYKA